MTGDVRRFTEGTDKLQHLCLDERVLVSDVKDGQVPPTTQRMLQVAALVQLPPGLEERRVDADEQARLGESARWMERP